MRAAELSQPQEIRFEVRTTERLLLIDGAPAKLGARAFDVLQALYEHRDRLVDQERAVRDRLAGRGGGGEQPAGTDQHAAQAPRSRHDRHDPGARLPLYGRVRGHLKPWGRRCARVKRSSAALLEQAPFMRLLATSQEPLRVAAEQVYRLDALALPLARTTSKRHAGRGPLPSSKRVRRRRIRSSASLRTTSMASSPSASISTASRSRSSSLRRAWRRWASTGCAPGWASVSAS